MSVLDQVFADLRAANRKAFIPFVTAGDPDLAFTASLIRELDKCGCSLCEIGIPYSDPIADGPVIQASYTRALAKHIRLNEILKMTAEVAPTVRMPLVTMVSYAIVHRIGLEQFVTQSKASGIVGAIVPDLLVEEAAAMSEVCRRHDFSLIQLVTPTTPRERAVRIANSSTGFLYYVSVTGITGERRELPPELVDNVSWLRQQTSLPICIGFGISHPDNVRAVSPAADGVIVGSAIVRRVADTATQARENVLAGICTLVTDMMAALS